MKARDEGGPAIDFQLLAYPVVDADLTRQSYIDNGEDYLLTTQSMRWFWDYYCPDAANRTQPEVSPIHAASHAGLPPALIVTAEFDPLRDEGIAFYRMMLAAGVPARCRQVMGTAHATDTMVILCPDICRDTARSIADFAREDCASAGAGLNAGCGSSCALR